MWNQEGVVDVSNSLVSDVYKNYVSYGSGVGVTS